MSKLPSLPRDFPLRDSMMQFLGEYAVCRTYWYVPKSRAIGDEYIDDARQIIGLIFDHFLNHPWTQETQDKLWERLTQQGILDPYKDRATRADRTALVRIHKKLLETLGFLWVQEGQDIVITDAGLELVTSDTVREVFEGQIAKIQYPNPSLRSAYAENFEGLLPHLFLLQLLQGSNYYITFEEYEFFVNLAQKQEDIPRILRYIHSWRDLKNDEQQVIRKLIYQIPMAGTGKTTRYTRIQQSAAYQRALYTFPNYLGYSEVHNQQAIYCTSQEQVQKVVKEWSSNLKVPTFDSLEDWFAYFGDPKQLPSWYTYLSLEIEKAQTVEEATQLLAETSAQVELAPEEKAEIQRKQVEKGIEDFYVNNLHMLEEGLQLIEGGRQYSTPIGRIDLLCKSVKDEFVIVEIKADEAGDSVFGQILRYIGWIHRNVDGGYNNVRGIILAGKFPETARYSRIGLLKDNYQQFLGFKEHGLNTITV